MASSSLQWCESSLRGEGILVGGLVHSGNHASLDVTFRADVPYEGKPTEKRHVLVVASYWIDSCFPAEASLKIEFFGPMTTDSVISRWKRDLSQGSIWRKGQGREFKITGPRGHLVGLAAPFCLIHCSAMVTMAAAVAKAEPEGSHLKIAAQRLAYRLQYQLNLAADALDELTGG